MDYYQILGVPRDADKKQIKQAYKGLARQYHPDVAENKAEAERMFGRINEAYSVLSDEEKRAFYDRYGRAPSETAGAGAGADFGGFGGFGGFPFGDIFESIFDFGGRSSRRAGPTRGPDLRMNLQISLEEAFTGISREVELTSDVVCPTCRGRRTTEADGFARCTACHGTGQVHQVVRTPFGQLTQVAPCAGCAGQGQMLRKPCAECEGRGAVSRKRTLAVRVPPGIDTGKLIRMPGEGAPGRLGGPPGDLYLAIEVLAHEEFERHGDELIRHLKIKFTDAALGEKVAVPLLAGEEETLNVPAGTQSGTPFRFKGKGMPRLNRNSRGDLHVVVHVMVPTRMNAKQKKLLKEFAEAGPQEADAKPGLFSKLRDAIFG
ncbi:MAG: molecular chaperone DnaJ [Armatimonadetes bacterium]|nr:molecular chaperone DnaJ [Armatimonadota bacterium]